MKMPKIGSNITTGVKGKGAAGNPVLADAAMDSVADGSRIAAKIDTSVASAGLQNMQEIPEFAVAGAEQTPADKANAGVGKDVTEAGAATEATDKA
jgi:hypothetical protein